MSRPRRPCPFPSLLPSLSAVATLAALLAPGNAAAQPAAAPVVPPPATPTAQPAPPPPAPPPPPPPSVPQPAGSPIPVQPTPLAAPPPPPPPPPPHPMGPPGARHHERLMATGITVGAGLSLQLGRVIPNSSVSQDAIAGAFMPYVVISPAYWGSSIGDLCAAHHSAPDEVVKRLREKHGVTTSGSECFLHKLGVFVGKPFAYDVTTTVKRDKPSQRLREVRPLLTAGIAFTPSAFYTVGLGLSFADVERDDLSTVLSIVPTLSLGVNLDVLSLLR